MPTAIVDFEAVYDGKLVKLRAGRDWVSQDCELFRRFPKNFGRDGWKRARVATQRRSSVQSVLDQEPAWLLRAHEPTPLRVRTRGLPKLRTGPP